PSSYVESSTSKNARARAGTLSIGSAPRSTTLPVATAIEEMIIDNAPIGAELRAELRKRAELERSMNAAASNIEPERPGGRSLTAAEALVVKKILSCVARLNGRFGKGTVAAVLRGSSSKQIVEHRLNQFSTYGLLKDMTQDEITGYMKALIQAGCVAVGKGQYPTVSLTEFGREVMLSKAEVMLALPVP